MSNLCTSSWSALFAASKAGTLDVLPVRISVGVPKFWPQAAAFPYIEALAPVGIRHLEGQVFEAAFLRRLDDIGVDAILDQLRSLQAEAVPVPLALTCFEPAGEPCHRRIVARWLGGVPEWEPPTNQLRIEEL
jgi:hypothetical protein